MGWIHSLYFTVILYYVNERFAKMDYLLHDGFNKYDTFIFGSSRVQKYNPKLISSSTYNLGYSAGLPHDFLRDLTTLVDNDYRIRNVYLTIDDFHYKRLPEEVNSNINFVGYGSYFDNLKYKVALLLSFPEKNHIKYAMGKLDVPTAKFNIDIDGSTVSKIPESSIDWREHSKSPIYGKPTYVSEKNKRTNITISEIKRVREICKNNRINLYVIFNPIHITTYLANDKDNFQEFKLELSKITPYYDFATLNTISKDNYYWTETSHFRECVADMIICKVLDKEYIGDLPSDFGRYVPLRE